MNVEQIIAAMDDLAARMSAKGVKMPEATWKAKSGGKVQLCLWCAMDQRAFDGQYLRIFTAPDPIAAAIAYIDTLPDPEREGERKFTRKLAEAVDVATEYALPDKLVAPVRAAIREVNEMLLEAPK